MGLNLVSVCVIIAEDLRQINLRLRNFTPAIGANLIKGKNVR